MTHCRICTGPAVAIGPDDHETICGSCIDEAVLDAYLADLPDEPIIREQVTRLFYLARGTYPTSRVGLDALRVDETELPLPDDLLIDELIELLADEEVEVTIERINEPIEPPVLRPSAAWLAQQQPARRGELHHFASSASPEPAAPTDERGDADESIPLPDQYPGYRHFRVLESTEVDGERTWTIRDVYRRG